MAVEDEKNLGHAEEEGSEWKLIGQCGVDSGSLVVVDPGYLKNFDNKKLTETMGWDRTPKIEEEVEAWLAKEVVFSGPGGTGVAFLSGLGDGVYNVYAKIEEVEDSGKRVTEVKIKLLD